MPTTQAREITPAARLENVRYAIRDLACIADDVARQGHKILPLNIGDPLNFDFQTPAHMIEAVYKAMRDGKNGYSPSSGITEALDAIRGEASGKGIVNIQDVFVTSGVSETVDICLTALLNSGDNVLTPCPDYPLYSAVLAKNEIGLLHATFGAVLSPLLVRRRSDENLSRWRDYYQSLTLPIDVPASASFLPPGGKLLIDSLKVRLPPPLP